MWEWQNRSTCLVKNLQARQRCEYRKSEYVGPTCSSGQKNCVRLLMPVWQKTQGPRLDLFFSASGSEFKWPRGPWKEIAWEKARPFPSVKAASSEMKMGRITYKQDTFLSSVVFSYLPSSLPPSLFFSLSFPHPTMLRASYYWLCTQGSLWVESGDHMGYPVWNLDSMQGNPPSLQLLISLFKYPIILSCVDSLRCLPCNTQVDIWCCRSSLRLCAHKANLPQPWTNSLAPTLTIVILI